jgi:choline dehydrogenase-like flavoprotein
MTSTPIPDVAIVGSGPSGGRIAWDLVRAGAHCVMLEAGDEFTARPGPGAKPFPANERDYSTQLFWGGGIELSTDARVAFLRARCLGGTSVVNQALMDRFDDLAFDDWRDRSGIDFLTSEAMAAHYDAVEADLDIEYVPTEHHNRNTQLFTSAFDNLAFDWTALRRAQGDCAIERGSDCIACLGGCPRESKQSSLVTTVRRARERGLDVQTGVEVERVEETADGVRLHVSRGRGASGVIEARAVVLAAGAIGTTGVLLRSDSVRAKLPVLGAGFACHPQVMSYALFDEPVDSHKGAFQAVKGDDAGLRAQGLKFENVFAPPIGTSMLLPGRGRGLQRTMARYRHMASMEVAIRDSNSGAIWLDRKGRVQVTKPLVPSDRAKVQAGLDIVQELFESVGAREVIRCTDTFGLHLMGGCVLGTDPATSVVGPDFRVHGTQRVFAADSSVFPSAPGINPSLTVMALSHRAGASIAEAVA